ncbi:MAG: hypothetical protein UY15_C0018G0004 [Parcubacteria group bacterium GW2011_GWA2_47_9]|nr:MAG: hypothetical protein UY15_C0018G0004 [Parcubacteria group bacterium GW2011_GWA2_47_9]
MIIQLLTSPGCHTCADVEQIIKEALPIFLNLRLEEINLTTPEGQKIIQRYGIMSSNS